MDIDFEKLMSNKSDEGLQEYFNNRPKYTPQAVQAAIAELQKRGRIFSEEELNTFEQELQQRKEILNATQPKEISIYWWGLLGFIPILGAIAGIILIVLGLVRHKDKILVFIGGCCILFTIGFYSYLFYRMNNSGDAENGFATISKIQINGLVKNIEFYKMQNGTYPDNLEQLQSEDNLVPIVDPLILNKSTTGNLNYRYQKIGDMYNLHSVGIDNIDNTSDDIYPTLANSDSSKIGFIKKR